MTRVKTIQLHSKVGLQLELHTPSGTAHAWNIAYKFYVINTICFSWRIMTFCYHLLHVTNDSRIEESKQESLFHLQRREERALIRHRVFLTWSCFLKDSLPLNMEQITDSEKSYSAIQDTLSNAEVSFMIPPPNDRFAGFFSASRLTSAFNFQGIVWLTQTSKYLVKNHLMRRRQCYERL